MKREQKEKAQQLRQEGLSMNEIAASLNVSKASVSLWVRGIQLTSEQRKKLSKNGRSIESIERRRENRMRNTLVRHDAIMRKAKKAIQSLSARELFLIGVALYWGEGGKTQKGTARVANSDPLLVAMMMRFFREVCEVPENKFRGHIHTFSHLNVEEAERYWASLTGIPRTQFYKTYSKPSVAGAGKRDTLPFGTFEINVNDTSLFLNIKGWLERMGELATSRNVSTIV
jgi:predicted transcriptional regulator